MTAPSARAKASVERVALLIEPVCSAEWRTVPLAVRLRRLQRAMVRGYGIRVVAERRVPAEEVAAQR